MGVSLLLEDDIKHAPPNHTWRLYENGTNVWAKRRILYNDRGDKVCTLLNQPKSKLIDQRAALLEIENEWLYHGIGVDGIQEMLHKCCSFYIKGMSRLDMCFDFNPTEEQAAIMHDLWRDDIYVQGKHNGSDFWSINNQEWIAPQWRGKRIKHQAAWGHKTSDVKWKLYYKTKELRDEVGGHGWGKPYIVDQWHEAGLMEDNVWRLEVSIRNCNNLDFEGERITQEVWRTQFLHLCRAFYSRRFVMRRNQGHKDKTNDDIVKFLPIDCIRTVKCHTAEGDRQHNGRTTLLRHLVRSLEDDQVLLDDVSRENVLWHIGEIVKHDGLDRYFSVMVGEDYDAFVESSRCRAIDAEDYTGVVTLEKDLRNQDINPNTQF